MAPNLARYLAKAILISIPALLGDALCRLCKLVGAECAGINRR